MTIGTRKIILWSLTLLIAAVLLFFWIKSVPERLASFQKEEFKEKFNFPKFEMPKFEIPSIENAQETSTTTE